LIVYKYIDFTHARVPRILFVRENDNLLVSTIEIVFRAVYAHFTMIPPFGDSWGFLPPLPQQPQNLSRGGFQGYSLGHFLIPQHIFQEKTGSQLTFFVGEK
jgi:hypothetical protein